MSRKAPFTTHFTRIPRAPTAAEQQEILAYLLSQYTDKNDAWSIEDAKGTLSQAFIAVFDHYISDGPGYAGRVFSIIYSGGPEIHELLVYRDNKLVREPSEWEAVAVRKEREGEHETREGEFDPALEGHEMTRMDDQLIRESDERAAFNDRLDNLRDG